MSKKIVRTVKTVYKVTIQDDGENDLNDQIYDYFNQTHGDADGIELCHLDIVDDGED